MHSPSVRSHGHGGRPLLTFSLKRSVPGHRTAASQGQGAKGNGTSSLPFFFDAARCRGREQAWFGFDIGRVALTTN